MARSGGAPTPSEHSAGGVVVRAGAFVRDGDVIKSVTAAAPAR